MNYEDIFKARGAAYALAMRRWPDARAAEFQLPIRKLAPAAGAVVIDIPSGGGDLARYLPSGVRWHGHEPCATFFSDAPVARDAALLPLPWPDGFADAAFSIAGVHHLDDRAPLYREIGRVLRPGGRCIVADVHRDSRVARFLDDFVGRHNSTGHAGRYLSASEIDVLQSGGLAVRSAQRLHYRWWFDSHASLGEFCRLLFDLRDVGTDEVVDAAATMLGVTEAGGRVGLAWDLFMICAEVEQAGLLRRSMS